jgi:hypothetical protein
MAGAGIAPDAHLVAAAARMMDFPAMKRGVFSVE